jgi:protein-S-isoprenylcysteine O-methyltransferase Ste14
MSLRKKRIALTRAAFVPVILLALFVRPTWDTESTTAFLVESSGYLVLLAGLAIRIWSIFYIGGRKSHELVTEGPYSVCRNPLYVGTFLVTVGACLCFENLLMLAAAFLIVVPMHLAVSRWEEKHLLELFPEAFPEYARTVPRFWPRLRNYHSPESLTVPVRAIRRIAIDTTGVLLIPAVEDLVEILHRAYPHFFPVLLYFP